MSILSASPPGSLLHSALGLTTTSSGHDGAGYRVSASFHERHQHARMPVDNGFNLFG